MRAVISAVAVAVAVAVAASAIHAQPRPYQVSEAPGILVPGDFDGNGIDDVLVFGAITLSRTYFGSRRAPHFVRGPKWPFDQIWSLADTPLFVGGHLYVPVTTLASSLHEVRIYRFRNRAWEQRSVIRICPGQPGSVINSLRIHPFHRDVDGDKQPDVIAAWGDAPHIQGRGVQVAHLTPSGPRGQVNAKPIQWQTRDSVVVDIHRALPMVLPKQPEYTVTLSAQKRNLRGGFGFLTIQGGLKPGNGTWARWGPALSYAHFVPVDSPVWHGKSNLLPVANTPMVQLVTGESCLFHPTMAAPYVGPRGEVLPTDAQGKFLDQCTADFDGDGRDEAVLIATVGVHHRSHILLGDPSRHRTWAQRFDLTPSRGIASVFHGTIGDFDGDGDTDLLVSYTIDGNVRNGFFALFVADRGNPGKPCLRRLY